MPGSRTEQNERRDLLRTLSECRPWVVICTGMAAAFLVFAAMFALESLIFPQPPSALAGFLHFLRGFIATASGMTVVYAAMKRKEVELTDLRDALAHELEHKKRELVHTGSTMEKALHDQRGDFISALKHRLRTPVLASRRVAQLLLEGAFGELTAEQYEVIALLADNEDKQANLIDKLVELYRYQNGIKPLKMRATPANHLIEELKSRFLQPAQSARICLTSEIEPADLAIHGDRDEILTLLGYLVENALEHARESIHIRMELNADDLTTVISVEDDGRGIADGDLANLFERFYEVSSNGRHPARTGTTLCLCRQIARAHRGDISCNSKLEHGTQFLVRLPQAGDGKTH